jgi:hypothetical protein
MRATQAIDLAFVRRAHDGQQYTIAKRRVSGQVGRIEERPLGGAATHEQAR